MADKSKEKIHENVAEGLQTEAETADTTNQPREWDQVTIKEELLEYDVLVTTEAFGAVTETNESESLDKAKMGFEVVVCPGGVKEEADVSENDPLASSTLQTNHSGLQVPVHSEDRSAFLQQSDLPNRRAKRARNMVGQPNNIPKGESERKKKRMALARSLLDESDEEVDSEDSYIPDGEDLIPSSDDHDTDDSADEGPADGVNADPATQNEDRAEIDVEHETRSRSSSLQENICHDVLEELQETANTSTTEYSTTQPSASFYGKRNCFTWSQSPVRSGMGRESNNNMIRTRCNSLEGPARQLGNAPTPKQVWDVLFTSNMNAEIIECTNAKLRKMRSRIKRPDLMYKDVDEDELNALFAIILFCSIFKSSRERLSSLFSTSVIGRPLFRGIMTEKRCCFLLRALRFDDTATREARLADDEAACISNIFNLFVENCQKNYSPGSHCTIDETLVPFRGRVNFRMYMPNKPAKHGIKLMCLADAGNAYLCDAYIYTGKGSDGATLSPEHKKLSSPSQSVIRLSKSIRGSNRNITCGNRFTSVELAEELRKTNLTLVGTLEKHKPQIPPEFQPSPKRAIGSSIYGFTEDITLVSHVTKKNKAVLLLSTMHHTPHTDPRNGKPEIISLYNNTKSGVDTLDQKCSVYSANRRTRRWPLAIFYHLMAACSSNAFTLYEMFPDAEAKTRFEFVNDLALSLANNYVKKRLQIPNLSETLKKIIQEVAGVREESVRVGVVRSDVLEKRKACRYCRYSIKRNTKFKCIKCDIPTCGEHSKHLCCACVEKV